MRDQERRGGILCKARLCSLALWRETKEARVLEGGATDSECDGDKEMKELRTEGSLRDVKEEDHFYSM